MKSNEIILHLSKDENREWMLNDNPSAYWSEGSERLRVDLSKKRITVDYSGRPRTDINIDIEENIWGLSIVQIFCVSKWGGGYDDIPENTYDPCYSNFFPPNMALSTIGVLGTAAILGGLNCIFGQCRSFFTSFEIFLSSALNPGAQSKT